MSGFQHTALRQRAQQRGVVICFRENHRRHCRNQQRDTQEHAYPPVVFTQLKHDFLPPLFLKLFADQKSTGR